MTPFIHITELWGGDGDGGGQLTHVVHDGGLRRLAVEVHHRVHAGRDVPRRRALGYAVHEEVQAAVLLTDHAHRVACLGGGRGEGEGEVRLSYGPTRSLEPETETGSWFGLET